MYINHHVAYLQLLGEERRNDLLREAAHYRQNKRGRALTRLATPTFGNTFRAQIGSVLIRTGHWLQGQSKPLTTSAFTVHN